MEKRGAKYHRERLGEALREEIETIVEGELGDPRIGLVSDVVPHESLLPRAMTLAGRIAANPPLALRYMKEGLRRTTPGNPRYLDAHFGPAPEGPLDRTPRPTSPAEGDFLGLGEGARLWLKEAASQGVSRIRAKMAEAVALARLHGAGPVDLALGHAAVMERFGEGDVVAILTHLATANSGELRRAGEASSLQPGTRSWEGFGR